MSMITMTLQRSLLNQMTFLKTMFPRPPFQQLSIVLLRLMLNTMNIMKMASSHTRARLQVLQESTGRQIRRLNREPTIEGIMFHPRSREMTSEKVWSSIYTLTEHSKIA